jgi:hypothetical protein
VAERLGHSTQTVTLNVSRTSRRPCNERRPRPSTECSVRDPRPFRGRMATSMATQTKKRPFA